MEDPKILKALVVHAQVDAAALESLGYVVSSCQAGQLTFDEDVRLLVWSNEHPLTEQIVGLFPNVVGIVSWGTDDAHLRCRQYLVQRGIRHYSVDNYSTTAVAEFVLLSILSAARDFPNILEGERPYGSEITGKKVGIIGLGKIGLLVAQMLGNGFGCDIHYHSRSNKRLPNFTYYEDPYSLFHECDFVVVAVKGDSFSINPEFMPIGGHAYLINVTGERALKVLDAERLIRAGRLSGALYDVEFREPHHTRLYEGLTLTPKVAYRTHEANRNRQKLLQSYAQEVLSEL